MLKDDIHKQPFDFLFRSNSETYPESTHLILELPGIFKQIENTNIYTASGRSLQADYVETILPDGKLISRESTVLLEHLSYKLTDDKINSIYEYKLSLIAKFKRPCHIFVATNLEYVQNEIPIRIDNDPILIKIISFDEEKINKILSNLMQKDYTNNEISEVDFLKLLYCITFAKEPFAQDVIKKCITLFASIERMEYQHQLDLHLALKIMIKYHFDNENEIRELLSMITKAVNENMIEKIPKYEKLNKDVAKYKNTINEMGKTINEKNQELNKKDEEIKKLKDKISRLENNI